MKRYLNLYVVVLAFLAVVGLGLLGGCSTLGGSDRGPLYEAVCLSQCPIGYNLLVEKCEEIDPVENAAKRQMCLDEAEALRLGCPLICKELNPPDPDPEPEPEVVE